jgi:D-glycero-D-manno-heptose 1,7-bisphosphate phosphatase
MVPSKQHREGVVFLDRDGTINKNYEDGPVYRLARFQLLPGAARGIRLLNDLGVKVLVVTNQGGINHTERDFGWEEYRRIEKRMHEALKSECDAHVDDVFLCHHADYEECGCRKPRTGLLERAASLYPFEPASSFLVGDDEVDLEAGHAMGLRTILVESGWKKDVRGAAAARGIAPEKVTADLLEAAWYIRSKLQPQNHEQAS